MNFPIKKDSSYCQGALTGSSVDVVYLKRAKELCICIREWKGASIQNVDVDANNSRHSSYTSIDWST